MGWRHTMGNDWGGRHKSNPRGAPKVSRQQVEEYAASVGVEVKRAPGWSMWWYRPPGGEWLTMGDTNYLALEFLKYLKICE